MYGILRGESRISENGVQINKSVGFAEFTSFLDIPMKMKGLAQRGR